MIPSRPITILLAEDHTVVRQGLCSLLAADARFKVVGQALNGRDAVAMARTLRPDVILMDLSMPALNGMEATRQVLAENPAAKVIVLTAYNDDQYVERVHELGAMGFLQKSISGEQLTRAIVGVVAGERCFSPDSLHGPASARSGNLDRNGQRKPHARRLTPREAEVLQLVAEGSANKQIAATLGISIKTVEKHRQHLMDKLSIHDTAGLTRYALAHGVVEADTRQAFL